ncbi:MAG: hypothetical protein ACJ76N_19135 [Thermoanaerobaculia bacterium]
MSKQYSETLGNLARLTAALGANATEIPHLEGIRSRLEKILADAQKAAKQQAALTASKQETTERLQALAKEGLLSTRPASPPPLARHASAAPRRPASPRCP